MVQDRQVVLRHSYLRLHSIVVAFAAQVGPLVVSKQKCCSLTLTAEAGNRPCPLVDSIRFVYLVQICYL